MPVPMELSRIIISEVNDQQVIYLKEVDGERTFPILIGIFEATSIDRRVKGFPSPRPLTHDLIVLNGPQAIQAADTRVEILGREGQVLGSFAGSKNDVACDIFRVIQRQLIRTP
jgi:hypothetical protein